MTYRACTKFICQPVFTLVGDIDRICSWKETSQDCDINSTFGVYGHSFHKKYFVGNAEDAQMHVTLQGHYTQPCAEIVYSI